MVSIEHAGGRLSDAEQAYTEWIRRHEKLREAGSARRRRLLERDDFGERRFAVDVWYPAVGHFENLHPEYEVLDYRDGSRFVDFAYIRPPYRTFIEIDDFEPHQTSRKQFNDDRFRQNQLVLDDWIILRFSYDDIRDRPRQCQQTIQQLLGKFYGIGHNSLAGLGLTVREREIVRWAKRLGIGRSFAPKEVETLLGVSHRTARQTLRRLLHAGLLEQAGGNRRISRYRLTSRAAQLHL